MAGNDNRTTPAPTEPHPKLTELIDRLSGRWRVKGSGIDGKAEYKSMREGLLLVMNVDFVVSGTEMKVIQHVTYNQHTDTLQADYMDTMGNKAIYTWVLDGQKLRVSLGKMESKTFFEAKFNDDNSQYVGTWHYPDDVSHDAGDERIIYSRISVKEAKE